METDKTGIIQQLLDLGLIQIAEDKLQLSKKENIPTPPTKAE